MTGYQRARGVVPAAPYRVAVVRWLDTTSPLGWQSPDDLDGDPCTITSLVDMWIASRVAEQERSAATNTPATS